MELVLVYMYVTAVWSLMFASVVVSQNTNNVYYNSRSGGSYPGLPRQRYRPQLHQQQQPQTQQHHYNYRRQHPRSQSPPQAPHYSQPPPPQPPQQHQRKAYCNPYDCKLPSCYCAGQAGPRGLDLSEIPQMVIFTFDDAVNEDVLEYYQYLFKPDRANPNGCTISATFFVSHEWTNYTMVKELYLNGHEVASHSITHRSPESWWYGASYSDWQFEMDGQRSHISKGASIPKAEIRGIRAPFLALGSNEQFQLMTDFSFEYDSTFMTGPHKGGGAWPFTLDYQPSVTYCSNRGCPKSSYPGIWEIPMNRWVGLEGEQCVMVDVCNQENERETLEYLRQNFNRHYRGNRAPFGVNMHATWFNDRYKLEAMNTFIKELVAMDDVYIVTAHQVLEWMRAPQPLINAKTFPPWRTTCATRGSRRLMRVLEPTRNGLRLRGSASDQKNSISLSVSKEEVQAIGSNVNIQANDPESRIVQPKQRMKTPAENNLSSKSQESGLIIKKGQEKVKTEKARKPSSTREQAKDKLASSSKSSSQELQKQDQQVKATPGSSAASELSKAAIGVLIIAAAVVITLEM